MRAQQTSSGTPNRFCRNLVWECLEYAPGELIAGAKAMTFPATAAAECHDMMHYFGFGGLGKQVDTELGLSVQFSDLGKPAPMDWILLMARFGQLKPQPTQKQMEDARAERFRLEERERRLARARAVD